MRGTNLKSSTVECPKCKAPIQSMQELFRDRDSMPISCTVRCKKCGSSVGLSLFGGVSLVWDGDDDEDTTPDHKVPGA